MEFCPMCNFMVYTKLNKIGDTPTLSHYCKNCGWENVIEDTKDVTSLKKKSDKVETSSDLEQAQNQVEGIEKAQDAAKKAKKGQKQNKIQSTKKSQQNLKHQLKRIDLDDLDG